MAEKEYIERDGLVGLFLEKCFKDTQSTITYGDVIQIINAYHRADVREVRHGKWIKHKFDPQFLNTLHSKGEAKGIREKNIFWTCSECNNWGTPNQKYCLNCGAKMDKE